jgi:restriction system protein
MTNVWCVRAEFGTYTSAFLEGGYVAIGWLKNVDLSSIKTRQELYPLYKEAYPSDTSNIVIGIQVGQIARFLLEMASGDVVITPDTNTELLRHGVISGEPSYFFDPNDQKCPYPHRRRVGWSGKPILRSSLSVPLQNTLRSSLTVFNIAPAEEILRAAGHAGHASIASGKAYDPYEAVLERVLQLDDKEFEILVSHLLTALGFEGSEVTGKTGDGGVDAKGELNVANLAKVKVFVQAKRYKLGSKISASTVRQLRQAIPFGGQGAFITTADFQSSAHETAVEAGFPRIGLVNGRQLVDLLVEHWEDIPSEFQTSLALKRGLVLV